MSRIYRALEKAEEEKRQGTEQQSSLRILEEKTVPTRTEEPILQFSEEEIEDLGPPPKEGVPILIVPPRSFASEEFRKLKTQIFHRLPNPPHSILVTSATPKEGKTVVAVNLATAIAQEIHRKAILMDGDLRKPDIHLEKGQNQKGLSNYLLDGTPLSEILINSELKNLQIIMGGPPATKSSELIGSKRMEELLKSLKEFGNNTYIVIDSPPIISATEPILFSKMVDGIILVVMADRTPREAVSRAIKSLDRQKIIGAVFNQVDINPSSHYSKYYYRYYRK
jgi:capsular exopolysaccharide synthesis family protein